MRCSGCLAFHVVNPHFKKKLSVLFNIYLNDLFFALKDIEFCNFADNTTSFVCDLDLNSTLNKLEEN